MSGLTSAADTDDATPSSLVQAGLNWLKVEGPRYGLDWRLIDPEIVEVADMWRCPLAQSSPRGDWDEAVTPIWFDKGWTNYGPVAASHRYAWAERHGFDHGRFGYTELDNAWRDLLLAENARIANATLQGAST